jgi:anti-sigma-K factor RskA
MATDHVPDRAPSGQDLSAITESLHRTSGRVHAQEAAIAVLKIRSDDDHQRLKDHEAFHTGFRNDAEARERRLTNYVDEEICALRTMLTSAVSEIKTEWERQRRNEREDQRAADNRRMWAIALIVTAITAIVPTVVQLLLKP